LALSLFLGTSLVVALVMLSRFIFSQQVFSLIAAQKIVWHMCVLGIAIALPSR